MRIMVFDVPAEYGGALSILKQYYNDACADVDNEWIFIVSKPELPDTDNVKVARLPWTKKSWFHRLWFDNVYALQLVRKYKPDKVISLQNTVVKADDCFQELYVHQPLPFCEKRFSFAENKKLWVYQNIISKLIYRSIRKADSIIVQTLWMKDAVCDKAGINEDKVKIVKPQVNIPENAAYEGGEEILFFYPASRAVYKNHDLIYKAVRKLKESGYDNFKVLLTIQKDGYFEQNYKDIEDLIEFCGYLNKDKVDEYYRKSILLFPSYIETFGLPLLEARLYGCPIIASDCAFSKEILTDYEKTDYISPFSMDEFVSVMKKYL